MYKNRILNLIILALILGILGVGGNIIYKNYQYDCEKYNNEIIEFTVELIKGHHTLEDIDALDANDDVKNSLREYYQNTFYSDDDLIMVYEDIDKLVGIIDEVEEYRKGIDAPLFSEEYNLRVDSDFYFFTNYNGENITDDLGLSEEEQEHLILLINGLNNYNPENSDTKELVVENGNLYVNVNSMFFNNGSYTCYYKGFKFDVYRDILDKKIRSEILNDTVFQSYERKNVFEEDDLFVVMLKDSLSNTVYFRYDVSFGKLSSLQL